MDGNSDNDFVLSSVFSESYFTIPDYQRDYAWTVSNVNDLLDDLEFVHEQNEAGEDDRRVTHYFGTIVLEDQGTVEPTDFEDYTRFAVVDGQQRLTTTIITVSTIIDEFERIASSKQVQPNIGENIQSRREDIYERYVEYESIPRLQLGGIAENAYCKIILGDTTPEDYLAREDIVEAGRRIARARATVLERLSQWQEELQADSESSEIAEYYKLLKQMVKIITTRFEVNVKIVDDVDEAARMFKVINNRGRGLALHDKVRSHLVYCASQSRKLESQDIYERFNRVVQNVTVHDGFSDSEVDDLMKIHWVVFTSERSDSRSKRSGPSKIHKRLSHLTDFASVRREGFEDFIEPYLESLENFSERYPYMSDRDKFAAKYQDYDPDQISKSQLTETIQKVQSLYIHSPSRRATTPLLIAVAERYGVDSEAFVRIVEEVEKLVFRYGLVMSHGAQGYSSTFYKISNDVYWAGVSGEVVEKIFNSDSVRYHGYESKPYAINEAIDRITKKQKRIAPIEETITEFLDEGDVLDGEQTTGWGGVRNRETIKYLMYEYERSLRSHSGKLSLAPYHEVRDNFQVEHLVPKTRRQAINYRITRRTGTDSVT